VSDQTSTGEAQPDHLSARGGWRPKRPRVRSAVCALVSAGAALVVPAAALAATQTAHLGDVSAAFTFHGSFPKFRHETLTITRAGTVRYSAPVVSNDPACTPQYPCSPANVTGKGSSVHVLDLEHNGSPDVMLDLFTNGAHCCFIEQIFSYDSARGTYDMTERNFGDPGANVVDLSHNGRYELLTADDRFAYAFTSFAASGLPIQILTFSHGRFHNVTRHYRRAIAKDAARWLAAYKSMGSSQPPWVESAGFIAAWAADQEMLGHSRLVNTYLNQQAKAGHLKTSFGPGGRRFVTQLMRFLRRYGYLR
jgi:hypothetical protein